MSDLVRILSTIALASTPGAPFLVLSFMGSTLAACRVWLGLSEVQVQQAP